MPEQQHDHPLPHLSPATLCPSLSHQPLKKWLHIKRQTSGFRIHKSGPGKSQKVTFLHCPLYSKHMPQGVLGLQPAPAPGKGTAGAFASFIPHHMNHIAALLVAAPAARLAAPTSPCYTGQRAGSRHPAPTVHSKQRPKEQVS